MPPKIGTEEKSSQVGEQSQLSQSNETEGESSCWRVSPGPSGEGAAAWGMRAEDTATSVMALPILYGPVLGPAFCGELPLTAVGTDPRRPTAAFVSLCAMPCAQTKEGGRDLFGNHHRNDLDLLTPKPRIKLIKPLELISTSLLYLCQIKLGNLACLLVCKDVPCTKLPLNVCKEPMAGPLLSSSRHNKPCACRSTPCTLSAPALIAATAAPRLTLQGKPKGLPLASTFSDASVTLHKPITLYCKCNMYKQSQTT